MKKISNDLYTEVLSKIFSDIYIWAWTRASLCSGVTFVNQFTRLKYEIEDKGKNSQLIRVSPQSLIAKAIKRKFDPGHEVYNYIYFSHRENYDYV
mgnify:CR=1 FL=1